MVENLSELKIGETPNVLVMLKAIESAESSNGVYQKLIVRDKFDHEMTIFNFGGLNIPEKAPAVVKMGIMVKEYRGEPSLQFVNFQPVENGKLEDFLPKAYVNYREAWSEIVKPIGQIRPGLKAVVQQVLKVDQSAFLSKALSGNKGFSRRCGILEATLKLMKSAITVSETCGLDKDLMVAGAALYFIGHVDTIDGAFNMTEDDTLLGAGVLAQNKVITQVQALLQLHPKDEELKKELTGKDVKLLSHILLSRSRGLNTAIPEAVALRHLSMVVIECDMMKAQ